jgi:hypothetical protein
MRRRLEIRCKHPAKCLQYLKQTLALAESRLGKNRSPAAAAEARQSAVFHISVRLMKAR